MTKEILIRAEGINKDYFLGRVRIPALKNISISVSVADFLVIAGSSGSGKTTLLNIMGLIDTPTSGSLFFREEPVAARRINSLYQQRRDRIGFIFQTFNLIPVMNVYENVEYPLILQSTPRQERRERVGKALEQVGLLDRRKHKPRELSGGQRQRVSIARAVVKRPDIVLADEPTANLDSTTGLDILELMEKLNREDGITFVFSSHDPMIIGKGRRVVHLRDGEIESSTEAKGGRA